MNKIYNRIRHIVFVLILLVYYFLRFLVDITVLQFFIRLLYCYCLGLLFCEYRHNFLLIESFPVLAFASFVEGLRIVVFAEEKETQLFDVVEVVEDYQ